MRTVFGHAIHISTESTENAIPPCRRRHRHISLSAIVNNRLETLYSCSLGNTSSNSLAALVIDLSDRTYTYEFGSLEEGWQRIMTIVHALHSNAIPMIATEFHSEMAERLGEYIPVKDRIKKPTHDAFALTDLEEKICDARTLLIMGFNRDCCVWKTAETARRKGYEVLTCPELMFSLPRNVYWKKDDSGLFYERHTIRVTMDEILQIANRTETVASLKAAKRKASSPTPPDDVPSFLRRLLDF